MTELSGFWSTSGTPSGHQVASYTQTHWSTAAKILAACNGFQGIAPGYLNSMAGTVTGANTVAINTGAAVADGKWYINDASLNVNIPSAVGGGNTRIDRIVICCDWASFSAVVIRRPGVDAASPTPPAYFNTPGTTVDILLYQALVNTSGTVTLTDERVFAQIATAGITDANVTYAKLASGASKVTNRQGGSATHWDAYGTNNYVPTTARIQCGAVAIPADPAGVTITFPVAFSYKPIVMTTSMYEGRMVSCTVLSTTQVQITSEDAAGSHLGNIVFWLAIGPE